jgi:hypothetical protein
VCLTCLQECNRRELVIAFLTPYLRACLTCLQECNRRLHGGHSLPLIPGWGGSDTALASGIVVTAGSSPPTPPRARGGMNRREQWRRTRACPCPSCQASSIGASTLVVHWLRAVPPTSPASPPRPAGRGAGGEDASPNDRHPTQCGMRCPSRAPVADRSCRRSSTEARLRCVEAPERSLYLRAESKGLFESGILWGLRGRRRLSRGHDRKLCLGSHLRRLPDECEYVLAAHARRYPCILYGDTSR